MQEITRYSYDVKRQAEKRRHSLILTISLLCFVGMCFFCVYKIVSMASAGERAAQGSEFKAYHTQSNDDIEPASDGEAWNLVLINKWNYVPADYETELTELSNGESVDTRIYPELQKMFDTARSEGIYPVVSSGYRTHEKQQRLLNEKIAEYKAAGYSGAEAEAEAKTWVAPPGASEHQIGIAVDIHADGIESTDEEVHEWLKLNAHKYGFIYRYPPGKIEITGINDEPWHYRYVGVTAATEIFNQGICLEEYLEAAK